MNLIFIREHCLTDPMMSHCHILRIQIKTIPSLQHFLQANGKHKPKFKKKFFKKMIIIHNYLKAFINIIPGVCLLK